MQLLPRVVNKRIGKTFIITASFLLALLPLFSTPTFALPNTCPNNLTVGDEIKVPGKPAIYVLDNSLRPRYFFSGYVYKSFKTGYGGYKTITQECLLGLGSPNTSPFGITYRPGSYIVKRSGDSQLYAVLPGNSLAKITSAAASTLHRSYYQVQTLDDREWNDYTCRKADITSAQVYPGMTFKVASDQSKVWYVDSQSRLRELSANALTQNYIIPDFIVTVPDSAIQGLSKGDMISGGLTELTDRTQSTVGCGGNPPPQPPPQPPPGSDTTAPTVSITSPATGATVSGMMTFSANAADNNGGSGVDRVDFYVDNQKVDTDNSAPYTISWNTAGKTNQAIISLQVEAFDKAGNSSGKVGGVSVKVDNSGNTGQVGTLSASLVEGGEGAPTQDQFLTFNQTAPAFGFKLIAQNEPVKLTSFRLVVSGAPLSSETVNKLTLYKRVGGGPLTPLSTSDTAVKNCPKLATNYCTFQWDGDDLLNAAVDPANQVSVYASVTVGSAGNAKAKDAFSVGLDKSSLTGKGTVSNQVIKLPSGGLTSINSLHITTVVPWKVTVETEAPPQGAISDVRLSDSLIKLGTVKITNYGPQPIFLDSLWFNLNSNWDNQPTGPGHGPTYKLVVSNNASANPAYDVVTGNPNGTFNIGSVATVGAGQSRWFTVAIDTPNSAVNTDHWQLTITENAKYHIYESDAGYDHNGDGTMVNETITNIPIDGRPILGTTRLNP